MARSRSQGSLVAEATDLLTWSPVPSPWDLVQSVEFALDDCFVTNGGSMALNDECVLGEDLALAVIMDGWDSAQNEA